MADKYISGLTAKTPVGTDEIAIAAAGATGEGSLKKTTIQAVINLVPPTDISGKQNTLVSATNIKTINGSSILGSGNLVVTGVADSVEEIETDAEITDGVNIVYVNPDEALEELEITLPENPSSKNEIEIYFGGTIESGTVVTALTITPNTGQTILQATEPTLIEAGESIAYKYNSSLSKWYRK
jgi:hypothetical protein